MVWFRDLSPLVIFGFQQSDSHLCVSLRSVSTDLVVEAKCVDKGMADVLITWGFGVCVRLFNVNGYGLDHHSVVITSKSGVRRVHIHVQPKEIPKEVAVVQPKVTNRKWACQVCKCFNYASKVVCSFCGLARREGPSAPLMYFKDKQGLPYKYEMWTCESCYARKNSHWNETCWKCGVPKKKKKKQRSTLMKVLLDK